MKKILIAGASGFVGKHLAGYFLEKGFHVTGLGTSDRHPFQTTFDAFEWIQADTTREGAWQASVAESDIVINLTGRSIFQYWTKTVKQAIYDSRVLTTRHLVAAIGNEKPATFISTSAVGIYGDGKNDELTEARNPGSGFLASVCRDWEAEALKADTKDSRVVVMRFGVVLGSGGGALSTMIPAFKLFAGGPLGSGRQWFPWIHIRDIERAVHFIINHPDLAGTFNFVGPTPVRQKEFAKSLGRALHRPAIVPAPSFAVKLIMGELGRSLLESQKAIPRNLTDSGYEFSFPDVDTALTDILGK